MLRAIFKEIDDQLFILASGGHFMGVMIGDFTIWPLSWLIEGLKERIKR